MERLDRHDIGQLLNGLHLELLEAAEVVLLLHDRNCHTFNRLFLVVSERGGGSVLSQHCAKKRIHTSMRCGDIILIPSQVDLEFSFQPDMRFISFHFHLDLFSHYNIFSKLNKIIKITDSHNWSERLSAIFNAPGLNFGNLCLLNGIFFEIIASFCSQVDWSILQSANVVKKYLPLLDHIRKNADAETRVVQLCEQLNLPYDRLSRSFSADCGITLKGYLTASLVRRAETLLLAPAVTAREVSDCLRFNNEFYFSYFFKKHTGMSPRAYQQRARANAAAVFSK